MATPRVFLALAASLAALTAAIPSGRASAEDLEVDVHDDDEDEDSEEDDVLEAEKREEANRAHVAGNTEGSLAAPIKLDREEKAAQLCTDVQSPRSAAASAETDVEELKKRRREAFRNVYSVTVAP